MPDIQTIAERLAADWAARAPYQRLTGADKPADLAEAYRIQAALHQILPATRGPIAGRKIALASATMQAMVGLDTPVAGAIFASEVHHSPARIPRASFRRLGLEYELAFEMAADVAPATAHSADMVRAHVAAVRPCFELIEDKDADYSDICGLTLAADNAWCGGIVLGGLIEGWQDMDLGNTPSVLHQDGQPPEDGNTGAADPWGSLAWVLNHFGERGETVAKGEQIITGSILKTRFPGAGDRLVYEIPGKASVEIAVT